MRRVLLFFFLLGTGAAQAQDTLNTDSIFFRRKKIRELLYVRDDINDSFFYRFDERGKLREYLSVQQSDSHRRVEYVAYNASGRLTEQRIIMMTESDTDFFVGAYHGDEAWENYVNRDFTGLHTSYRHLSDSGHYVVERVLGDPYFQYWEIDLEGCYDQTIIRSDTSKLSRGPEQTITVKELTPKQKFLSQVTTISSNYMVMQTEYGEPVWRNYTFFRREYARYEGSRLTEEYKKCDGGDWWPIRKAGDTRLTGSNALKIRRDVLMQLPGRRIRHGEPALAMLCPAFSYERFVYTGE